MNEVETIPAKVELQHTAPESEIARLACAAVATGTAEPPIVAAVGPHQRGGPVRTFRGGGEPESAEDVFDAIKAFFTGASTKELDRTRKTLRWPLFYLACPKAEGAELEVSLSRAKKLETGWKLSLFGNGVEGSTSVSVTDALGAKASSGQRRLVFLQHDADVIRYRLSRRGHPDTDYFSLALVAGPSAVGVSDVADAVWSSNPAPALLARLLYRGSAAETAQDWSREEEYRRTTGLVLGLDWEPVSLGATLDYEIATTVTLRAALPGGADWEVLAPSTCPGMVVRAGA